MGMRSGLTPNGCLLLRGNLTSRVLTYVASECGLSNCTSDEAAQLIANGSPQWLKQARNAVGAVTALVLLVVVATYLTHHVNRAFSDLSESGVALLAALNCALAARSASGRLRHAWIGLAGATLSWGIGQSIWSWYELVQHTATPFPGLADIGFLGFPLGAVIALAVFPSNVSHAGRWRMTLDGLMVTSAIGLVSWATVLDAVVKAGGNSSWALTVSVAYPASDIALLVVCVLVLSRSRAHQMSLAFIAAGLALMAVADSGFAYLVANNSYATGNLIDLGWFFAFGTLAFAAMTPGATVPAVAVKDTTVAGTFLPYVPLGGAVVFLAWQIVNQRSISDVETALAVLIVLLVLVRQFLTVHDNQRLARTVAEQDAELRHQAFHDLLTGLANRALFVDRAAHALELHRRDQRPLSICFLDLDGFKAVNDQLGHNAGDELLRQASTRFRDVLSEADTLARFGGDEFAVLLEEHQNPVEVGRALLECLVAPFSLAGGVASVSASVGVAQIGLYDPTPTVDELLVRADQAMYVVKRRGKADVLLHSTGLQLEDVDELELGHALAQALVDKQVTVSYQPIVDLSTGQLDTLEALARWAPGGRPVSTEVFLRIADACDLMDSLFRFVLGEACTQLARWTAIPGGSRVRVAVNVSPQLMSSSELPAYIASELLRLGVAGDQLVLEITETGGFTDTPTTHAVCLELQRLGVRLSVDDFGTGLSSLARLRDLPINEVKIDRTFITNIDQDETRRRFVGGVLKFAEHVGLTVVAEGVEREAERAALAKLGCHRAQGFLFSRPVPSEAIDALLRHPGSWRSGMPAPPPEPHGSKVRQNDREDRLRPLGADTAP